MQTYLKSKSVWGQFLLFLAIAFAMFMIASIVGVFILSKLTGVQLTDMQNAAKWDLGNAKLMTFLRGMILLQFLFLFVLPSLLFAYLVSLKPLKYTGIKLPSSSLYWLLGILLIVVAYPLVEYLGVLNQKMSFGGGDKWLKGMEDDAARQLRFILHRHTIMELIKNLVFVSLFAGIGEELFFRGIMQHLLIKLTKNPWMGIVLTAAIFSAFHFQFYGFLPRFFLGILLGAIYWYSGSLLVAMLAHFLYDAVVIVVIYLNPKLLDNASSTILPGQEIQLLVAALISGLLTAFVLTQMRKKSIASYGAVYNSELPSGPDQLSF